MPRQVTMSRKMFADRFKAHEVFRTQIIELTTALAAPRLTPTRPSFACPRWFNLAERLGDRPDAWNPCRDVQNAPTTDRPASSRMKKCGGSSTISTAPTREGLEHPFVTLAIRLQFEFAARMSEVLMLEWDWIDLDRWRVTWHRSGRLVTRVSAGLMGVAKPLRITVKRAKRTKELPGRCQMQRVFGSDAPPVL